MKHLPEQEKLNNKIIIVDSLSKKEMDNILIGFCNRYNLERIQAKPRLYKLNDRQFAITFPFDTAFKNYFFY